MPPARRSRQSHRKKCSTRESWQHGGAPHDEPFPHGTRGPQHRRGLWCSVPLLLLRLRRYSAQWHGSRSSVARQTATSTVEFTCRHQARGRGGVHGPLVAWARTKKGGGVLAWLVAVVVGDICSCSCQSGAVQGGFPVDGCSQSLKIIRKSRKNVSGGIMAVNGPLPNTTTLAGR